MVNNGDPPASSNVAGKCTFNGAVKIMEVFDYRRVTSKKNQTNISYILYTYIIYNTYIHTCIDTYMHTCIDTYMHRYIDT
jgi:hypothetical protein